MSSSSSSSFVVVARSPGRLGDPPRIFLWRFFTRLEKGRLPEAGRIEPRRHLHVGENRFFKSAALVPPVLPLPLPCPSLPASGNCKNFRCDAARLLLARRMNFANWISWCWQWDMQKALGAAFSPWCLHRFSRLDIFLTRRAYWLWRRVSLRAEKGLAAPAAKIQGEGEWKNNGEGCKTQFSIEHRGNHS